MEQMSEKQDRPVRTYTVADIVMAWAVLLLGYGFWRVSPMKYYPMGALIWTLATLSVTVFCLYRSGIRLTLRQWLFPAGACVISLTYLVTDNSAIHFSTFLLTAASYLVWLLRVNGNGMEKHNGELLLPEAVKAIFVIPFSRLFTVFSAWFRPRPSEQKHTRIGMTLLWIVLGLVAAAVPVVIVMLLLCYDENFMRLFDGWRNVRIGEEFAERIACLIGAVPVAMLLFGAWTGNREHVGSRSMSHEACMGFMQKIRFLPRALTAAFICPLLGVYALFFFSQYPYYVSAFSGVLPSGMSYAVYAREGFFQLCGVCGINAVILAAIMTFCKRKDGFDAVRVIFVSLLALSSVLLAATALSKMLLYIGSYGLTPRRVYTSWMMLMLAACFLAVIVRGFCTRMNLNAAIIRICTVFFAVLALSNPNGKIAAYNVDKYLSGELETVDMEAMTELYDAAVPEVYRLWEETDGKDGDMHMKADAFLDEMSRTVPAQSDPFLSFSIPSHRAKAALDRWRNAS